MFYSIVIPVFNSAENLLNVVSDCISKLESWGDSFEIILVDDSSEDESWELINQLSKDHKSVKGIRLSKNNGQQMALYVGLQFSYGEYALTMDDDGQHTIDALKQLESKIKEGCDLIYGVYSSYGSSGVRSWGSKAIGFFFKTHYDILKGQRVSSYRLIHKSVYGRLNEKPCNFVYLSAELLEHAKKVGNIIIPRYERMYGKSGYSLRKCIQIGLKLYLYYGNHFFKNILRRQKHETCINGWCGELSIECHTKIESTWL